MQGGKAAAESAINMQGTGDYSAASTRQYERRWNFLYGYDFGKVCVTAQQLAFCGLLLELLVMLWYTCAY